MNINVIKQSDISLNGLVEKQAQGFSVLRSAHVGNARLYNQVIANAGIDILLVDQNVTGVDINYVPEAVVHGGVLTSIAPLEQLTMRATTFDGNQHLDELHAGSLRSAFPNTKVLTDTEYLRAHESIAAEIVRLSAGAMPELFRRFVRKDEKVSILSDFGMRNIDQLGIVQLSDDPRRDRGILCPNEVNILINFVAETLTTGRDEQFHISGPDMIVYIKSILPTMQRLARLLDSSFLSQLLPESITVQLIPGTNMSIAGTRANADVLQSFNTATELFVDTKAQNAETRRRYFNDRTVRQKAEKDAFTNSLSAVEKELERATAELFALCPDVLCGPRDIPFVSQYDTLQNGGLFVPEITKRLTMNQLADLKLRLSKHLGVQT